MRVEPLTSFGAVNKYLRQFHDQSNTMYNLDNMRKLVDFLGNPQEKFKAVHVAGTSGKTSTSYYMSALLAQAGKKVGLTVSPHVDELNERVQINGQLMNEADFCKAISEYLNLIEPADIKPSWFEAMVGFAYWFFAQQNVDYAVIEVGLGGLKDGTNVIERVDKVCIITDIGYDHIKTLGNTLGEIAEQKAGIIHPHNAVFMYEQAGEVMASVNRAVKDNQASLHIVDNSVKAIGSLPSYQTRNWQLADAVYDYIAARDGLKSLSEENLAASQAITIPGRMDERHVGDKILVMDGAHNQQKMQAFVNSFSQLHPGVKPAVLLSMRTGKEYRDIGPILESFASRVITTNFLSSQDLPIKSLPASELALNFGKSLPVVSIEDQHTAFEELLNGPEQYCVITGSFYLLGQIRNNEHLV